VFVALTHVAEGTLLEMLAGIYVRPSLPEHERIECERINQELEGRTEAMERRFGIDTVPESDE
jgi:hypothetical protein